MHYLLQRAECEAVITRSQQKVAFVNSGAHGSALEQQAEELSATVTCDSMSMGIEL
jgi:hypothetical protein